MVKGDAPDWWGEIRERADRPRPKIATSSALEIKEVNDVDTKGGSGRETVGGRYVFHHMIWSTARRRRRRAGSARPASPTASPSWPVHEVGRNADFFDAQAGRLLKAGSSIVSDSVHLHSNGRDTKAHLEIGFKFMPKGYKPDYRARARSRSATASTSTSRPMEAEPAAARLHACCRRTPRSSSFEPHLHAPGARMCLEAIWGYNIQTLNCVGYDHNWVRGYDYDDDSAPLLPKGTILHIIGYMDNSPSNKNVPDPRNWQGSGNRSVANMFIDLGKRVVAHRRAVPGRDGGAPREAEADAATTS